MADAAIAPIVPTDIQQIPWGWNPNSAFMAAQQQGENQAAATAKAARETEMLPIQKNYEMARMKYYEDRGALDAAKASQYGAGAGGSDLSPITMPSPGDSYGTDEDASFLGLTPAGPKTSSTDGESTGDSSVKGDTAGSPGQNPPTTGSANINPDDMPDGPLKELLFPADRSVNAGTTLGAIADQLPENTGPVANGNSTDASPAPGADPRMLADNSAFAGTAPTADSTPVGAVNETGTPQALVANSSAAKTTPPSSIFEQLKDQNSGLDNAKLGAIVDSTPASATTKPTDDKAPDLGTVMGAYSRKRDQLTQLATQHLDSYKANLAQAHLTPSRTPAEYNQKLKFMAAANRDQTNYLAVQRDLTGLTPAVASKFGLSASELNAFYGQPAARINAADAMYQSKKAPDRLTAMNSILNQIKAADKVTPDEELKRNAYLLSQPGALTDQQTAALRSRNSSLIQQLTGTKINDNTPSFNDPTGISDLQDQATKLNTALQAGVKAPINVGGKPVQPSSAAVKALSDQITAKAIESGAYFDPSDSKSLQAFNAKAPAGTSFMLKGDNKVYKTNPQFDPATFLAQRKKETQIAPASGGLFGSAPSFSEDNPHAKAAMASMATGGVAPSPQDMSGTPYTAANLKAVNDALANAQAELEASKGNDWSKLPGTASNLWYSTLGNPDVGLAKEYESAKQKVAALTAQKQDIEARLGNQK